MTPSELAAERIREQIALYLGNRALAVEIKTKRLGPGEAAAWHFEPGESAMEVLVGSVRILIRGSPASAIIIENTSSSAPTFVREVTEDLVEEHRGVHVVLAPEVTSDLPFERWENQLGNLEDRPVDDPPWMVAAHRLVEEILEAYGRGSSEERERLRVLADAYPSFFYRVQKWLPAVHDPRTDKPDPVATARLHLHFYSLLDGRPGLPEWGTRVHFSIEGALNAPTPVPRQVLARLLQETAELSSRRSWGRQGESTASWFERLATELRD